MSRNNQVKTQKDNKKQDFRQNGILTLKLSYNTFQYTFYVLIILIQYMVLVACGIDKIW